MTKVLVVDDTPVDCRLAGGLIEQSSMGIEVAYAENGEQALERIRELRPDAVVTDLHMPEMNGLELVERVRMQYPDVPVILMTAHGSEDVAVLALEQGASSYVPKTQLNEKLCDTVEDMLAMVSAEKANTELLRCQQQAEYTYALPNSPELLDTFVNMIQQVIEGMEFTDHTGKYRVGVAVREALFNAMLRGNLEISFEQIPVFGHELAGEQLELYQQRRSAEPYAGRKVHVRARIGDDEARFEIGDEGPGFDHAAAMEKASVGSATAATGEPGRGLVLMRTLMDGVTFNDAGNQVTLVKKRDGGS